MELLISVSLLAVVSLVSVSIVMNLLKGAVKAQMAIDIEQASSFVFLKMENDIKKSYTAQLTGTRFLTLRQGSPISYTTKSYTLAAGTAGGCSNNALNCILLDATKLTDDTVVGGKPGPSAISIDLANSGFAIVTDTSGNPVAVNIKIKFEKPTPATNMFRAETTLDTTVVLRGSY